MLLYPCTYGFTDLGWVDPITPGLQQSQWCGATRN